MRYAAFESPIGRLLLAHSGKGVCLLAMAEDDAHLERLKAELQHDFGVEPVEDAAFLQSYMRATLAFLEGRHLLLEFPLDVQGTAFQKAVWQALKAIPYGQTRSYKDIAATLGKPAAVRAVGGACGANPVLLAVPCHRVIAADGGLGGFSRKAHALDKKRWLLALEHEKTPRKLAA
jgi:AraC family transcriptional regulator of adaptative response/methylated-DNA-[protein]-cysteine methyltransferase